MGAGPHNRRKHEQSVETGRDKMATLRQTVAATAMPCGEETEDNRQ